MQIFEDIASLKQELKTSSYSRTLGFVPTMGALHQGHISLIEASKKNNDLTICSIFINPTQFNNPEDLKKYPRTLEKDISMLIEAGCDYLFLPSDEELYGQNDLLIKINFGYLENIMEGKYRPGHFNGVGLVVSKLFNIVRPDKAYFGQKDLQQFSIIKHLVDELNFGIDLNCMPVIRESDGLAMSSRNINLNETARKKATAFYNALNKASKMLKDGMGIEQVKSDITGLFNNQEEANLEYFEIVNAHSLLPLKDYKKNDRTALCIAGYVGGIRLIDNVII
ncbi:MAG: pantoate--beta-alanine ligase [Candidatus Cyclobacteriaceae bacterium M2_1C_046]